MKKKNDLTHIKEESMFLPVKELFEQAGYTVHAEVNGCDVTASKDGSITIIELKLDFSIKLLLQAIDRLKLSDTVYVAIVRRTRSTTDTYLPLVKRLGIGLIEVVFVNNISTAFIRSEPEYRKTVSGKSKRRSKLLTELSGRSINVNIGGTSKRKIMTAYREQSINIACFIDSHGPSSPASVKKNGHNAHRASEILSRNFYNWFSRIERGVYTLTEQGNQALTEYSEIADFYRRVYGKTATMS